MAFDPKQFGAVQANQSVKFNPADFGAIPVNSSIIPSATTASSALTPQELDLRSAERYGALSPYQSGNFVNLTGNPAIDSILTGLKAGATQALPNLPGSFLNFAKNFGLSALNILNPNPQQNTLANVLKVGVGGIEKLGQKIGLLNQSVNPDAIQVFDRMVQAAEERYGSLDNLARTATNDPFGFGAEVFAVLRGVSALAGKTEEFDNLVSQTAQAVEKPVTVAGRAVGRGISRALSVTTGKGTEAIQQAATNPNEAFTQGLRGENPEKIVEQADNAFEAIVNKRRADYLTKLEKISKQKNSLDISPIKDELQTQLGRFGVKIDDEGELDFSRSSIANKAEAVTDIKGVYRDVSDWGNRAGDRTPLGLDMLKKRLDDLYSPSGSARALVTALRSKVRDVLNSNVPQYQEMTSGYKEASDLLFDVKKVLGAGSNASPDTILTKLTRAINSNSGLKKDLLDELGTRSQDFVSQLAGHALNPIFPGGLIRGATVGVGVGEAIVELLQHVGTKILGGNVAYFLTASPRVVGEFLRALNMTGPYLKSVMNVLNKARVADIVTNPALVGAKSVEDLLNQDKQGGEFSSVPVRANTLLGEANQTFGDKAIDIAREYAAKLPLVQWATNKKNE